MPETEAEAEAPVKRGPPQTFDEWLEWKKTGYLIVVADATGPIQFKPFNKIRRALSYVEERGDVFGTKVAIINCRTRKAEYIFHHLGSCA